MKRNRGASNENNSRKKRFPFSPLFLVSLVLIIAGFALLVTYFLNLDLFKIKDVVLNNNEGARITYLLGKNIFAVNLDRESQDLTRSYPNYKNIRVIRLLPDRLYVDFQKRVPVAVVRLSKSFCVDKEGVLFECFDSTELNELPVVLGLDGKIFNPRPGTRYNYKELNCALEIAKELSRLKDFKAQKIDVKNLDGAAAFLITESRIGKSAPSQSRQVSGFEVRIGKDRIKEKIDILSTLIEQSRNRLTQINYIDLRFAQPVIKFYDDK